MATKWKQITTRKVMPFIIISKPIKNKNLALDLRLAKIDFLKEGSKLIKFYIMLFWDFLSVIRFTVYLAFIENENHWIYFLDLIRHLKGLIIFRHVFSFIYVTYSLFTMVLFRISSKKELEWYTVIRVIRGLESINIIGFNEYNQYLKFFNNVKNKFCLIKYSFWIITIISIIGTGIMEINSYNFKEFLIFGTIELMLATITYLIPYLVTIQAAIYHYVIILYCKMRFKIIKESVNKSDIIRNNNTLYYFLIQNNSICGIISSYNKFWKRFYFIAVYSVFVIDLLFLHFFLFTPMNRLIFFVAFIVSIIQVSIQLSILLYLSSINDCATYSRKLSYRLYSSLFSESIPSTKLRSLI
jgi:hypothetical protein